MKMLMRMKEVREMLGISPKVYHKYVEYGLLKPLPVNGRRTKRLFARAHVEALLHEMSGEGGTGGAM